MAAAAAAAAAPVVAVAAGKLSAVPKAAKELFVETWVSLAEAVLNVEGASSKAPNPSVATTAPLLAVTAGASKLASNAPKLPAPSAPSTLFTVRLVVPSVKVFTLALLWSSKAAHSSSSSLAPLALPKASATIEIQKNGDRTIIWRRDKKDVN